MDCPKCKLVSPPGAERCDCGYDFKTGTMKESYLTDRDKQLSKPQIGVAIIASLLVARLLFALIKTALDENSATPAVLAVVLLAGIAGFWIWKGRASRR